MADEPTPSTTENELEKYREELKKLKELEAAGELTPQPRVPLGTILLLSFMLDLPIAQGLSVLLGKLDILSNYATVSKTRVLLFILYPIIVAIIHYIWSLSTLDERKRREEELSAIKTAEEQKSRIIKNHQRAMLLISKCEERGIESAETEADQSAIWIIAQSIGITSRDEAMSLYSEAKDPSPETEAVLNEEAERERVKEVAIAKEEDSNDVTRLNELYPVTLVGKDKYLTPIKKQLQELEEKHRALLAAADYMASGSAYLPTKPKNVTLEAAKGQLIGGPGLAAAKATAAENYNSSHPGGMPSAEFTREAIEWAVTKRNEARKLEPQIEALRAQVADIEARLIDLDNTDKYAGKVQLESDGFCVTFAGNIKLFVESSVEDAAILDEPAIIDGSFVVKAWMNGEQIGQAVYCPEGFDGNLKRAGFGNDRHEPVVILTSKELKEGDEDSISITFKPLHVWAIQKNPAV